jgi:hypothetical protein
MTYQYKREPLSIEEADRLFTVADTLQEKLCVYGLLETGLEFRRSPASTNNRYSGQQERFALKARRTVRKEIKRASDSDVAAPEAALRKLLCDAR